VDEYVQIGKTTEIRTLKLFSKHIIAIYGPEYLQPPNREELQVILSENEERGGAFQGVLGASTACIGHGRIVHWGLQASIKGRKKSRPWF
jgi:hypothetical protein